MDWSAFRAHFPVTRRWAYLDHAAVSPIPDVAAEALTDFARRFTTDAVADYGHWVGRIAEVRRLAARLINSPSADDIAFIPNTTAGIGLIAEGFPWRPGDNVVIAAEEYPSNQYPWLNLRDRGVEVRAVPSRGNRVEIDDVRAAIDGKTRVLSMSHVQFGSGFRADLDALGELCRSCGVFFFVDAIQGLGAFPVDVQATPIDALAADGHKWLLSPEGAGLFYLRRDRVAELRPIGVGAHSVPNPYDYGTIDPTWKPHAGRYEGGSPNVGGISAQGASLELLLHVGVENIRRRVLELTDHLCAGAASAGFDVFSSRRPGDASGIVSLTVPGSDPRDVMRRCREAGVVVNARLGRVRVSPHAYNTEAEIDRFLAAASPQ